MQNGNFEAKILKHSVSPAGEEAISFQFTYERMIHAEVLRHRCSQNYSSSRAIPYERMKAWMNVDPAMHLYLGSNRAGMQSGVEVENSELLRAEIVAQYYKTSAWTDGLIVRYNPHKEVVNRYLEPWGWITGISTWGRRQLMNFFALRCTKFANPNIQRLAISMLRCYVQSIPRKLKHGDWHTPYFDDYIPHGTLQEFQVQQALVWSVARSAWISYDNPNKNATYEHAMTRHNDCVSLKHGSVLEHQLQTRSDSGKLGLVPGYDSYRMMIPGESADEVDMAAILAAYEGKDFIL